MVPTVRLRLVTVDSMVTGTPEMTGRGMGWGEVVVQESVLEGVEIGHSGLNSYRHA